MGKDKVIIAVVATIVFSGILFGILMAYRDYYLPMKVYSIDETVDMLKSNLNEDDRDKMHQLSVFNELSRSCKMRDNTTGEIRKFSKSEMDEFYNAIGGKEAVIQYLSNIEDETKKWQELEYACHVLKIITSDEFVDIWNNRY